MPPCGKPCCVCQIRWTYWVSPRLGSSPNAPCGKTSAASSSAANPAWRGTFLDICLYFSACGSAKNIMSEHHAESARNLRLPQPAFAEIRQAERLGRGVLADVEPDAE